MGAALVLLLVGLGAMAAGVLIGRYYVPDDRQLRRTAKHSRAYMRALSHLIARDHETVVRELRSVVEENVDDVEPYFALGAMFRSSGEHERAIRVHQALALRERDRRKLRQRALYELGLDFRAAGMPRRATRALEEVLLEEPAHEGALRGLAALYEEQARFNEAAELWQRLGKRRGEDLSRREHHLLVAAAQAALGRSDLDSAKQLLKAAQRHAETAHFYTAAAELAAARGNDRGAKDRLRQALVADPALAPHLLPGLIAAEQGLAASEKGGKRDAPRRAAADDLADDAAPGDDKEALAAADAKQLATADAKQLAAADAKQLAAGDASPAEAGAIGTVTTTAPAIGAMTITTPATGTVTTAPRTDEKLPGTPLVSGETPAATIAERVMAVLAEVEAQTGPRLEIALIRSQLVPPGDTAGRAALTKELATQFPDAIAARVAAARLASASADPEKVRAALDGLVAESGALAWALRGRWQCAQCSNRPAQFSWRCGQCRRWGALRMETGIEPPPVPSRDRRAERRAPRPEGLLGAAPDESLPAATLDPGLTADELALAGTRRSLLGRVGGWVSGVWRRDSRR